MNKKKSATATEQLVKLRKRLLPSGNTVLFLDYIQNGERMRESLGLTLLGAKTVEAKQRNKATMVKAENARLKKEQELLMGKQVRENQGPSTPFLPYYRAMVEDRHGNPDTQGNWGNWGNWRSCLRYLEVYCTEDTTFADITPKWVQGFKNYLDQVEKDTHKLPSKACLSLEKVDSQIRQLCGSITQRKGIFIMIA